MYWSWRIARTRELKVVRARSFADLGPLRMTVGLRVTVITEDE
jgi:hypothetical protein